MPQATTNVVMAGKQSQANKNFWYAYALWQQKVAQALARRRAEELARKRAEAEARARQAQQQQPTPPKSSSPLAKLVKMGLLIIALGGVGLAGGSVQVVESPMSVATQMVNDVLNPPNNSGGLEFCGIMAIICPVGGAGGIAGEGGGGGGGSLFDWVLLALATAIAIVESSTDTQVLPYPQIGPMPYNPDDEYLDEIPLDRILRIPWADFMNPDLDPEDEVDYYFRGTTEGYLGNPNTIASGITSTTTQPGVATVFATVAETMYGGTGVVYIFSATGLANISPSIGNVLSHLEFEVGFNILPNDLEKLAMLKITDEQARAILATMGFNPIDSRIEIDYQNTVLRDLVPLTKSQISEFVLLAAGMGGLP